MSLLKSLSELKSHRTGVETALVAGLPDQLELLLSRDAVERTFERLAALTLGQLPAQECFPRSNAFAASVLILREFMHHLQFLTVTIKTCRRKV